MFDPWNILVMLIFSSVGFVYFSYGKKHKLFVHTMVGVLLLVYSYFMPNIWWNLGIGIVLAAIPFFVQI